MTISPFSKLHNEVKIVHGKNIKDSRGNFKKTIFGSDLKSLMPEPSEVLNSVSHKNVVRGLHFQNPPNEVDKFITCLYGEINDVFLNIKRNSSNYGSHDSIILNQDDEIALFIPKGYAHGFSVLSEIAVVTYLQSGDFNEISDSAINPMSLDINWKVDEPIISDKDRTAIEFTSFESKF